VSTPRLTTTSFIVLGLVEQSEPATPYDLKRIAQLSVFKFWTLPHTQLYTECERLASVGYLDEEREEHGRRRRLFRLTESGRGALEQWRADPVVEESLVRDASLLKLFLGGDPAAIAAEQLPGHRSALQTYEALAGDDGPPMAAGPRVALQAGIAIERAYVAFWSSLLGDA
jgi:DNA-binding PadR family transcriptional regulator